MTSLRIGPIVDDTILSQMGSRSIPETVARVMASHHDALFAHVAAVINAAVEARVRSIVRADRDRQRVGLVPLPGIIVASDLTITTRVALADEPAPIVSTTNSSATTSAPAILTNLTQRAAFPCTYPGCERGPHHPFTEALSLSSHRFAAHGIRSSNAESIARAERRDRARVRALEERTGGPVIATPGHREHLRRRLTYLVPGLAREMQLPEPLIVATMGEICTAKLAPSKHYAMPSVAGRVHDQAPAPTISQSRGNRRRKPA